MTFRPGGRRQATARSAISVVVLTRRLPVWLSIRVRGKLGRVRGRVSATRKRRSRVVERRHCPARTGPSALALGNHCVARLEDVVGSRPSAARCCPTAALHLPPSRLKVTSVLIFGYVRRQRYLQIVPVAPFTTWIGAERAPFDSCRLWRPGAGSPRRLTSLAGRHRSSRSTHRRTRSSPAYAAFSPSQISTPVWFDGPARPERVGSSPPHPRAGPRLRPAEPPARSFGLVPPRPSDERDY